MKRLLLLLLAALLLAGCGVDQPQPTTTAPTETAATAPTQTEPETPSLYDPEDPVETRTGGAVRAYPLGEDVCAGLARMGERLLVITHGRETVLTLLSEEDGGVEARITLPASVDPDTAAVQTGEAGLGYFDAPTGSVVILDPSLEEVGRYPLPEEAWENFVLSPDMKTVYYPVGEEIRALDLETGISRLLRHQTAREIVLIHCLFDGRLLECVVTDEDGRGMSYFLSTENGESLGTDVTVWNAQTFGDAFFLQRMEGLVEERLFGSWGQPPKVLNVREGESCVPALAQGGVLGTSMTDDVFTVSFYDLATGRRTAVLEAPGLSYPYMYDVEERYCWFVSFDEARQCQVLYRWETGKSAVTEEEVYTGVRYTEDAPDMEGLAECQAWADRLLQTYGVEVLLGKAAVQQPCDYLLDAEYQAEAFRQGLEAVEAGLAQYPEEFFRTLCRNTPSGTLHICLVRDISQDMQGVQYWPGGEAYIALKLSGMVEQTLHHELCHVLDAYVFANSRGYDHWESLNPSGFSYDYSYDLYQDRGESPYLTEGSRAFLDSYSMTFPNEDRARIYEFAMCPGMESVFEERTLQRKLRQICLSIREAFGWEQDPREFPWEQYLSTPLAYSE